MRDYKIFKNKISSGRVIDRKEVYMNQINSLIIEGNLVKDCAIVETVKDFKVCKMDVWNVRIWKNRHRWNKKTTRNILKE